MTATSSLRSRAPKPFVETSFSTYSEENDSDYVDHTMLESDTSLRESDTSILHSDISLDNISMNSHDSQETLAVGTADKLGLLAAPLASLVGRLSPSESTANLLLESHKRFGKFIHKHEVPRKVFHVSIGFITLYAYTVGVQIHHLVTALLVAFVVIFATDLVRLRNPALNARYCSLMGFLMREGEVTSYNGVSWYLLGLVLVFVKCPKDICVMAVLLLSWADTAASTVGRRFGHLTPRVCGHKSVAGSLAAFVTGVVSAYVLYGWFLPHYPQVNHGARIAWSPEGSRVNLLVVSLLSGLVASVSEAVDIFGWDDNFTIPVISGYVLWGVVKYFEL